MLTVSIIIVNWNTKDFLNDCLLSIPSGAGGISYEILIVDNASTDDSINFIENNFPNVKLIKNYANTGFAAACNQGAGSAMGRYLFFLNPDTVLEKDSIKKMIDFAEKEGWVGAVGPQLIGRDGGVQNSVRAFPSLKSILTGDTFLKRLLPRGKKDRLFNKLSGELPSSVEQVSGAAFLVKKDLWRNIGGMDTKFFMFYEEVDLCRRLKNIGYNIYYLPTAKIIHLGGGSRHKDRSAVFYYSMRSVFLYIQKYYSLKMLFWFKLIYKPLFLAELITELNNKAKRDFLRKCLIDFIKF